MMTRRPASAAAAASPTRSGTHSSGHDAVATGQVLPDLDAREPAAFEDARHVRRLRRADLDDQRAAGPQPHGTSLHEPAVKLRPTRERELRIGAHHEGEII